MPINMFLLFTVIPLLHITLLVDHTTCFHRKASMAPNIVQHPRSESAYKPNEDVTLDCLADTDSYALYEWRKDGRYLNLSGTNIVMSPGSGSIVIKAPSDENDGAYQCFVRNQFGTAVSAKSTVKKADLQSFPTVLEPVAMSPIVGQALSLYCSPPRSYPKGFVYWGKGRPHSNKLQTLENNERILLDYEGNLHLANVVPSDSLGGANYVCIVYNALLGAYVQGNDHLLTPVAVRDAPKYYPPQLLWSSPSMDVALKGQAKRIKCIFSGLPTPKVTWRRLDHPVQTAGSRSVVTPGGQGTELEIMNVETEDGGRYECTATNSRNGTSASKIITLVVQSEPFWSQARSPSTIQAEEESNVEVNCQAHGTPTPDIGFLFNGVPVEDLPPDPRRSISGYMIVYRNVTLSDSQVVQCIASNDHGSILANIILSVIAAPPSFIETPANAKVVEGQSVMFRCLAYGAPRPVITWRKGKSREPVSGDRFAVRPSGILEIKNASVSDSNIYHCHAANKFGTDDVTVNLTVRRPTRILPSFEELMVNASLDVSLPCMVEADPTERPNLVVEWRKSDEVIDYSVERRLKIHPNEFSLQISQSQVGDSANYSCHVRSSLDAAVSLPIRLTVSDRPDPPYDVIVSTCAAKYAIVSWKVGSDNNYPLLEFIVFYNNSIDGTDRFIEGARVAAEGSSDFVQGQEVQAVVYGIHPWSVYSFHVAARNLIGVSDLLTSSNLCVTSQMVPERNPSGVCSKRRGPTQLVIAWEEMLRPEWNGEGFHYIVSYCPLHSTRTVERLTITNPHQTELEIYDLNTFVPYEIYVQSANNIGLAPIRESEKRIGYSGEGVPLDSPANFELVSVNSTHGEFSWDAVDSSAEQVRGFFRGYRLRFWRSFDPEGFREEDVILVEDIDLCPSLDGRKHRSAVRSFDKVTGGTNRLWPYSTVTAGIVVLNHAYSGPLSNTVEFHTPEGVPGRVSSAVVIEKGSSHLRIKWDVPEEPNGVVVGYEISYQVAPPAVSRLQSIYVNGTEQLSKKLFNLEFSTTYRVSIAAATAAGTGESTSVFGETRPLGVPDRPEIVNIETGSDFANVTWSPSTLLVPVNPGHSFYLQYKLKESWDQWTVVDIVPETTENWINVTDLDPSSYEFQMVAVNGFGDLKQESRSSIVNADVGPEVSEYPASAPVLYERASTYWFIILICIIIFLILCLLIVCLVRYMRGDVYPVSKKERLCGNDPYAPEDVPFGEFKRQNSKSSRNGVSEISMESDDKVPESDSDDSLEEYDETDPTKFTEDGSFIGLYVGKNNRQSADSTTNAPTSPLNTFV